MPLQYEQSDLIARAARLLRTDPERILKVKLLHESLDARKKDRIQYVLDLAVEVSGEEKILGRKKLPEEISPYEEREYAFPPVEERPKDGERPVIVGLGPAGLFCAYVLARAGMAPLVLERGEKVEERTEKVEAFWAGAQLDPDSNVQFGEGGAGAFSDGKLTTLIKDRERRGRLVLKTFVDFGADPAILYRNKPHVGTDVLRTVVSGIREAILRYGGEIRFSSRMEELLLEEGPEGGKRVRGLRVRDLKTDELWELPCSEVVLAPGHSARDTFGMLFDAGLPMTRKPFSMGVRIEHKQSMIDLAKYGRARGDELPPADYGLHVKLPDGASAYTFCMCPGGEVFAAASEEGGVVTNGMSRSDRGGENANSALLVTLQPEDFPGEGVLAGMEWQRQIERRAFRYAGGDYKAPAQTVGDFLNDRPSTGPGNVQPTYLPGVFWGDLRKVLPEQITDVLARAIPALGQKLRGFDAPDAVLTGPETRSSSPVRVVRGEDLCSEGLQGLYPCGEGAGYAGGITSAAVDGMRCAEMVLKALE